MILLFSGAAPRLQTGRGLTCCWEICTATTLMHIPARRIALFCFQRTPADFRRTGAARALLYCPFRGLQIERRKFFKKKRVKNAVHDVPQCMAVPQCMDVPLCLPVKRPRSSFHDKKSLPYKGRCRRRRPRVWRISALWQSNPRSKKRVNFALLLAIDLPCCILCSMPLMA